MEMKQYNNQQKYEVTPLELFFDLIYVFALSQVTEFMMSDLSWLMVAKSLIVLGAIYMVWSHTSWAVTMIPAEEAKTQRMIILIIFIGFFMNASIEHAFEENGLLFVGTFLVIQFGRTIWTLIYSPNKEFKEHFIRVLIWQFISTPFWITGALFTDMLRVELWGMAMLIELIGTWTGHPIPTKRFHSENLNFDAAHLLERCRLLRIIALGEMVFSAGDALKEVPLNFTTVLMGVVSVAEIVSLWMLTFGRFVSVVAKYRENTTNPIRVSHYAINALVIILLGIVFISVGNKYIILHPYERVPVVLVSIYGGGLLMFLLAQEWYLRMVPKVNQAFYLISGGLLFIANVAGFFLQAWIYHLILGGTLIIVACFDYMKFQKMKSQS